MLSWLLTVAAFAFVGAVTLGGGLAGSHVGPQWGWSTQLAAADQARLYVASRCRGWQS